MVRSAFEVYLTSALYSVGALGPWAVFPIYVAAMALFMSTPLLGLAAGAMFGTWTGFLVMSASSAVSAGLMFWLGRHLTRGWVAKKVAVSHKIRAVDDAVTEGGWRMVVLLRQTAIIPFSLMNYSLGLSKIPFRDYMLATWLSMMPACLMYAYLGSVAGEIMTNGNPQKTTLEWVFGALGLVVTVGVGIYATRRVQKILSK